MNNLDQYYNLYSPAVVPSFENETAEQFDKRWAKFDVLPEDIKDRLSSLEMAEAVYSLAESFQLDPKRSAYISRAIRGYYCGELPIEDWSRYFVQYMGIDFEMATQIAKKAEANILGVSFELMEKEVSILEEKNIQEALVQYSNINEQLVTSIPLVLRISPNPVRPTVKNWITDYHEQMGLGRHETFDRGNYLFHSENSKRLEAEDRRKLSLVLRSLDEGTPLMIDPEKQEIVFDEVAAGSRQQAAENAQNTTYGNKSVASNLQQKTDSQKYEIENRQPKTINLRQDMNDAPQMRQDVRPAALTTNMQQVPMRPVQPPQNLPQAMDEKLSQYFGIRPGASATQRSKQYQQETRNAAPKKEFENKSPDFSQLLRTQNNVSEDTDRSVTAKGNQPSDEDLKPAGGTVSFSSPQQLSVEREKTIRRSPYRITPHSDTVV